MRPCNYNEAWGLTITSNKLSSSRPPFQQRNNQNTEDKFSINSNHFRTKSQHVDENSNSPPKISPISSLSPNHRRNVEKNIHTSSTNDCSSCLLHLLTCTYCQSKLKEFSKFYSSDSHHLDNLDTERQHNSFLKFSPSNSPFIPIPPPSPIHPSYNLMNNTQPPQTTSLQNSDHSESLDYKFNENIFYIMIGLMIGYIICKLISKK